MSLTIYTVDNTTIPHYISSQMVNSTPACSYVDAAGNLKFAKNSLYDGSGVWTVTVVVAVPVISYNSLLIVDNRPAIVFSQFIGPNYLLKYVRATNNNGSAWGAPVTIFSGTSIRGMYCSMCNVSGFPAVSFLNSSSQIIEYVRAKDSLGTTWETPIPITSIQTYGTFVNLKVFNGKPAICFYDSTYKLLYVRSNTTTGYPQPSIKTTWELPMILDANSAGNGCCMSELDNDPMISYFQVKTISNNVNRLKFISARTNGFNDVNWSPDSSVVISSDLGDGITSCVNVNGYPYVVYRNSNDKSLNLAFSTSLLGFSSWYHKILDNSVNAGETLSAVVIASKVGTFYSDSTSSFLKYIY